MVLYSNGCPRCKILESKLKNKGLEFKKSDDADIVISNGFRTFPILEIEGEFMSYKDANDWVNSYES